MYIYSIYMHIYTISLYLQLPPLHFQLYIVTNKKHNIGFKNIIYFINSLQMKINVNVN